MYENVHWVDTVDALETFVWSGLESTVSIGTNLGFGYELAMNCCMSQAEKIGEIKVSTFSYFFHSTYLIHSPQTLILNRIR